MACSNLRSSPGRRMTGGCTRGKCNKVMSFNLGTNCSNTLGFVRGIRLLSLLTGVKSTGSLIVRPTSAARSRLSRRRRLSAKMAPSLVEFTINVRSVRSVLTSISRTLSGVWARDFLTFGCLFFVEFLYELVVVLGRLLRVPRGLLAG